VTRRPTRPGPDRRDDGPRDDDALPRTGVASPEQVRDLAGAAAGGTRLRTPATPAGLTGLRLLVAVVLAVAGGITATPALVLIGAAIGTWALVTLARTRHELRTH